MKRSAPVLAILAAILFAAPAEGQSTTFMRSYFGCRTNVSCHLVTVTWQSGVTGFIGGTIRSQSWFGMNPWGAGYPMRLIVSPLLPGVWGFGDEYNSFGALMQPYYDETFSIDPSSDPNGWAPNWSMMRVSYGTPAGTSGFGPHGEDITLVQTPEPATLLLLGTGLGGVMAAARRRRRQSLIDPDD